MRKFNTEGPCIPRKHYMVDLKERIKYIRGLVDDGSYFTINRARQYGKTTVLGALARNLAGDYLVISLDFQKFSQSCFENERAFSQTFQREFAEEARRMSFSQKNNVVREPDSGDGEINLNKLFRALTAFCQDSGKPVVLIIDEVDSASNNQVFLDFLAQLRSGYLDRDLKDIAAFHSVILAGVYDVKNMKRKIRGDEEHKYNSPWNIAADFDMSMSFSQREIAGMLEEYEGDNHTGMDISKISELIYDYTSGYPFLVSRLCKLIDEKTDKQWTADGFHRAVRLILAEKNTLFDSLIGKLGEYPELSRMLQALLFTGKNIAYNPDESSISIAGMLGFVREQEGSAVISNRIFEIRLYNFYLSDAKMQGKDIYKASLGDKSQFIVGGHLNMRRVLEKFVVHFNDLYQDRGEKFLEEEGRKYFLLYLRPIINGAGNYYVESRTRELRRTDVIVDYGGEQHIVEMKIWHGEAYEEQGKRQLSEYLDAYHQKKGYLIEAVV